MTDWLLGIDFGTSNTAAAHSGATSGAVETLALSHTSNVMSSAVFVDTPDRIAVGDVAINSAELNPAAFVPSPKRLIGQQSVVNVNGYSLPAYVLVSAVLRRVLGRAGAAHGGQPPTHLVLTHPEAWSPAQVQVLRDAAAVAGADPTRITTISEPRAAAQHYSRTHAVDPGAKIAVFDFGGGTLDVAVLAATGGGTFDVIAARGDNSLGGKNFDALIRRWVYQQLEARNPALLAHLRQAPVGISQNLDDSIRRAKELLSEAPSATITVVGGGFHDTLHLTRDEFDELIDTPLDRAVSLTRVALADARAHGGELTALYLTGGSSRIPLVHHKLAALGSIATLDDPKTVVVQGSLTALATSAQYRDTQMLPAIPAAVDLLTPTGPSRSAGRTRPRGKVVAAVAATVVAALAAVSTVVLTTGGNHSADPAAQTSSLPLSISTSLDTIAALATTEEEILAALPTEVSDEIENCRNAGSTKNNGLIMRCQFKSASPSIDGVGDPTYVGLTVSLDREEAETEVLRLRQRYGAGDGDRLVESADRTAAAEVDKVGNATTTITYANTATGIQAAISSFLGPDEATRFLTRTGLIN